MAVGMLSKPPAVKTARNAQQLKRLQGMETLDPRQQRRMDFLQKQPAPGVAPAGQRQARQKLPGLTNPQNKAINQIQNQDISLGNIAGQQLGGVADSFEQPMDWGQFQEVTPGPVTGDYNSWRQEQIDLTNKDFEDRMNPVFQRQSEEFDQSMANRGIPMGSELYNQQKKEMMDFQGNQRQSNMLAAMNQAGANATQFANVGFASHDQSVGDRQRQISDAMAQRYQPMNEFNMLRGAQSQMPMANLSYWQQQQLANTQGNFALQAKRMGGGGEAKDPNNYNGTGMNYQDYASFNAANALMLQQAGQGGSGPSPWWQLAGGIAGAAAYGAFS